MQQGYIKLGTAVILTLASLFSSMAFADDHEKGERHKRHENAHSVQLGPRPFYLVEQLNDGELKDALQQCTKGPFFKSTFSIGHRGAALQFPEHTKESYEAAARQGAGIIECDVTFTKDKQLVCRHSQCDLATTTNILATPLADQCSEPFTPAEFDPVTGERLVKASATCCTSDITLSQFKSLCGKMDASNPDATTPEEFLGGTPNWRTDLYSSCATVLSHAESIDLIKGLGAKFTPELKSPSVEMPYQGDYTQADYAQQMIDEYKAAGVKGEDVWAQSFNLEDVRYWIENEPAFGKQAVFLDARPYEDPNFVPSLADFESLRAQGVKIVAPPMPTLLTVNSEKEIVPSEYAKLAKAAGLDIITWTLERSGRIEEDVKQGGNTFYYQTTLDALENDGDILTTLDVLAQDVGVLGIFSDWPATVTYYANCKGLK